MAPHRPKIICLHFCRTPRFETRFTLHCSVFSLDGVLFIPFFWVASTICRAFWASSPFYTHLRYCTSTWHSMGAAVIPFAFAGRIGIDFGIFDFDFDFDSDFWLFWDLDLGVDLPFTWDRRFGVDWAGDCSSCLRILEGFLDLFGANSRSLRLD